MSSSIALPQSDFVEKDMVEKRFQSIEGQAQGMQDEVGRLVVGAMTAVAEEERSLVETAHREAQQVAHGLQFASCSGIQA